MRVVIFYFSGTGNTSWLSRELVSQFVSSGSDSSAFSIEKTTSQEADLLIDKSDLVGFGYPIYGSDMPENMKDFMGALTPVAPKPTFVFCTQWKWSGDGAYVSLPFLKDKGFNISWAEHFLMPNNVCTPFLPFPYTNNRQKIEPVLSRAAKKANRFVSAILNGKSHLRGFNVLSFLAGSFQRIPFRKTFSKLRNDISVSKPNCTSCLLCVKICPVRNLFHEGDSIKTTGKCILCLRCYNFCPVSAIQYRDIAHNLKRGTPYRGPSGKWDGSVNSSW